MRAGDLRHRISIQHQPDPQTQGPNGEISTSWVTLATIWSSRDAVSGGESVAQDARTATMTWRYRIRRRTDVTPAMRILDGVKLLNIQSVQDTNKPGEMTLLAQEVIRG